jgi:hypothetical protein
MNMRFSEQNGAIYVALEDEDIVEVGTTFTISSPLIKRKERAEIIASIQDNFSFSPIPILINGTPIHNLRASTPLKALKASGAPMVIDDFNLSKPPFETLEFEGGSIAFSPGEAQNAKGVLQIHERGCKIIDFPISGSIPEKICVDFHHLPLSPERASLNFSDVNTQLTIHRMVSMILSSPKLDGCLKASLLNGLFPLLFRFGIPIQLPKPEQQIFLPDLEEIKCFHPHQAVFIHPHYAFEIGVPASYQKGSVAIHLIESNEPQIFAHFKKDQIDHFFINSNIVDKNNYETTRFNIDLLNAWLDLKYKFYIDHHFLLSLFPDHAPSCHPETHSWPALNQTEHLNPQVYESALDANDYFTCEELQKFLTSYSNISDEIEILYDLDAGFFHHKPFPKKLIRYLADYLKIHFADFLFRNAIYQISHLDKLLALPELKVHEFASLLNEAVGYLSSQDTDRAFYYRRFIPHLYSHLSPSSPVQKIHYLTQRFQTTVSILEKAGMDRDGIGKHAPELTLCDLSLDHLSQLLEKSPCLKTRQQLLLILNHLIQPIFLLELSHSEFEDLVSVLSFVPDQMRSISLKKEHCLGLMDHIIKPYPEKAENSCFLALIYLLFLSFEQEIGLRLNHPQFLEFLEEEKRDLSSEELIRLSNDLLKTFTQIRASGLPQELLQKPRSSSNASLLDYWENKQALVGEARPLMMAAFLQNQESFTTRNFTPPTPNPNAPIPLYEDADVIQTLGAKPARQKIQVAAEQSTSSFLWVSEIVKNELEAGASTIHFDAHLGGSDIYIVVQGNGSGMSKKEVAALKTPGKTTKRTSGDDPNFGQGFFSILKHFSEVRVLTRSQQEAGYDLTFSWKEGTSMIQQDTSSQIPQGTTLILKKPAGIRPLLELIKLKSQLISRCQHLTGIDILWQGKPINAIFDKAFLVKHQEPYFIKGERKGSIEVSLSKNGPHGVYCKGIKMGSLEQHHLSLIPDPLKSLILQGLNLGIFLPPQDQIMNRGHVVQSASLQNSIQLGALKAMIQYCLKEWQEGRMLHLLPYDFFNDMRSDFRFCERLADPFLKALNMPEPSEKPILIGQLKEYFSNRPFSLLQNLTLKKATQRLQNQEWEMRQVSSIDVLKKIQNDSRLFWNTLIQIPFPSSSYSLLQLKKMVKEALIKAKLINSLGKFPMDQEKLPEKIQACIFRLQDEVPHLPAPLLEQFSLNIQKRVHCIAEQISQIESATQKEGPESDCLAIFLQNVAKKAWDRDLRIQFYCKPDGIAAYVQGTNPLIHINLGSQTYPPFKQFYRDCQNLGFRQAFEKNGGIIIQYLKILSHEVAHLDEKSTCNATHDDKFNQLIAKKMLELFIRPDRKLNVRKALKEAVSLTTTHKGRKRLKPQAPKNRRSPKRNRSQNIS